MHKLIVIGHAGADAVLRFTPDGIPVVSFSVADNRRQKNGDKITSQTTWFRVTVWGNLVELAKSIRKGDTLYVEGVFMADEKTGGPRVWTSTSVPSASFDVRATNIFILGHSARSRDAAMENEIPY
jgi:single stranded DNA-binding protein